MGQFSTPYQLFKCISQVSKTAIFNVNPSLWCHEMGLQENVVHIVEIDTV